MLPQGQKALLTICLEELVSASFFNCAKHVNKKVHFIQVLKYLVFMHPRDKFLNEKLKVLPGISKTRTTIALSCSKESPIKKLNIN
jgi:hypothetical protein